MADIISEFLSREILPKKPGWRQDSSSKISPKWIETDEGGLGFLIWSVKKDKLWTASSDFFETPVGSLVIADAYVSIIAGITDIVSPKKTSKVLLVVDLKGPTLDNFKQNKIDATLHWDSCVNTSPYCLRDSKTFKFQNGTGKVKAILVCVSKDDLLEMEDSTATFEFSIDIITKNI